MTFALSFAFLLATQLPAETEVIGHYYMCSTTLELSRGKLLARRSLQDTANALYQNDEASWEAADDHSGSILWWGPPGQTDARLSDIAPHYSVHLRTEQRLPKITSWVLNRSDRGSYDGFAVTMTTGASARDGHAAMPLRVLLAFAGTSDTLRWSIHDVRKRSNGIYRQHAAGTLDTAAVREAAEALPRAEAMLDAMAASPSEKCELRPIHYDPLATI